MISSITSSTKAQYTSSWKLWWRYCHEKAFDFYNANVNNILDFLSNCYRLGSSYGTLNSHRSAIALINTNKVSEDERLKRFFRGIFKLRPTFPKYNVTWNPNIVLDYLSGLCNETINLELLTKKTVMLLALASGQRIQTLSLVKTHNIKVYSDKIIIIIDDLVKTSGIGRAQPVLNLPFFVQNPNICPATTLQAYLNRTADHRTGNKVLFTYKKPFRPASTQTIGRWLKETLSASGIDTTIFSAHSTRHAATSSAARAGVSFDIIRKSAGWTEHSSIFANFYNRPIVDSDSNLLSNSQFVEQS
ncbi:unnamed protein product [Plutella xylostella]|uniref:(diamondback moth) hypothetical protein n=1 Tax=Plutella xylostella TaxID=51655 RepID=A0A8S4G9J9_PLUXY|nr:unnamed protein product [Plutella xylostella]